MTTVRPVHRLGPTIAVACLGWMALAPVRAEAFEFVGSRWPDATAPFYVSIVSPFEGAVAPSGVSWDAAFAEAAAVWRDETGFDFTLLPSPADPCELLPGRNGTTFRLIACGSEFGSDTLAVTLSFFDGPRLLETDIVFNGWLLWDVYRGQWRAGTPEFRRVAVHELGHALGLDHEGRVASIMRPTAGNLETLQADDRAAVAALYGGCERVEPLARTVEVTDRLELTDCFLSEQLEGAAPILFDMFALELPDGGLFEASLGSSDFDAYLALARVDELGRIADVLVWDDDSGGGPLGTDARLALLLAQGEYRLLASARHEGATGEYRLRATLVPEPAAGASSAGVLAALFVLATRRSRRTSDAQRARASNHISDDSSPRTASMNRPAIARGGDRWLAGDRVAAPGLLSECRSRARWRQPRRAGCSRCRGRPRARRTGGRARCTERFRPARRPIRRGSRERKRGMLRRRATWWVCIGLALAVGSGAAQASPRAPRPDWQIVARSGDPAPAGGSLGRLALAPRIADDGAVTLSGVAVGATPPRYVVLRAPVDGALETLAIVDTAPPAEDASWQSPRLFAAWEGPVVWAEGFDPALVACGEDRIVHQASEWLFRGVAGQDPAIVASTGLALGGPSPHFLARLLRRSTPSAGFGRLDFTLPWSLPFVVVGPSGRAAWLADAALDPCFDDPLPAASELPVRPSPGGVFELPIRPLPGGTGPGGVFLPSDDAGETPFAQVVLVETEAGEKVVVARAGDRLPGDGPEAPPIAGLGFFDTPEDDGVLLLHATLRDGPRSLSTQALLRWNEAEGLTVLVRADEPSNWAGGAVWTSFTAPVSGSTGAVALFAVRAAVAGGEPARAGLWMGDASGVEEVLPFSGVVPGAPFLTFAEPGPGEQPPVLAGFGSFDLRVNATGEVAFTHSLVAADESRVLGVFGPGPDGMPRLFTSAPRPALSFGGDIVGASLEHLTDTGDLLVVEFLQRPGFAETISVWQRLPRSGGAQILLRSDDEVEVTAGTPGPSRPVAVAFDRDLTRIAVVRAAVADRAGTDTALFVAAVPVPEPAPSLGAGVAAFALARLARRRRLAGSA